MYIKRVSYVHIYFLSRGINIVNCVFLCFLGRRSPREGVTVSSGKSTDVTCKTHLGYLSPQLPWQVDLSAIWSGGSVVEFQHCNLWSLVRSIVVEITVYTADET